jgi:hypothetical protein
VVPHPELPSVLADVQTELLECESVSTLNVRYSMLARQLLCAPS